jgi:2-polyprenyl-6-methoxyphenol hydroxylase-like FAD-dependent oxidoreductase
LLAPLGGELREVLGIELRGVGKMYVARPGLEDPQPPIMAVGWETPRLLDLDESRDFYFDSFSQIRMDSWSRGRITLVGDAGYGPAPAVGGGTSLAAVAAYVLARELAEAEGDYLVGLRNYKMRSRTR